MWGKGWKGGGISPKSRNLGPGIVTFWHAGPNGCILAGLQIRRGVGASLLLESQGAGHLAIHLQAIAHKHMPEAQLRCGSYSVA